MYFCSKIKTLILLLILPPLFVSAQANKNLFLRVNLGLSTPVQRDAGWDFRGKGININGDIGYKLNHIINLKSTIGYTTFPFDSDFYFENTAFAVEPDRVESGATKIVAFTGGIEIKLSGEKNKFFLYGNFGVFRAEQKSLKLYYDTGEVSVIQRDTKDGLTYDLGLGVYIPLKTGFSTIISFGYRSIMRKGIDVGDLRAHTRQSMRDLLLKLGLSTDI